MGDRISDNGGKTEERIRPTSYTEKANTYRALRWQGVSGADLNPENAWAGCGCCVCKKGEESIAIEHVWDQRKYAFLEASYREGCPDYSVHPSLWSNGVNNHLNGLFVVKKNCIYQVRGYDIANLTMVKTTDGWVIIDTLISRECTKEALKLADEYFVNHQSDLPLLKGNIKAVIISHSHVDHFGGTQEVIEYNNPGKRPLVIASKDFVKYALRENLFAGPAMSRRAGYQYGTALTPGTEGCVSVGIGISQSTGTVSFVTPDITVDEAMAEESRTGNRTDAPYCIDGLRLMYQYTPGTEAPTEINCYFPEYKALWMAENCNGTLHNLYTLRGAEVRDGNAWAAYLMEAAELFHIEEVEVIFQAHNWPHWSSEGLKNIGVSGNGVSLKDYLVNTAAVYKFIHDQTLLNINRGYKMEEVARKLRIPKKLTDNAYLLPYYGTPSHDAKAVYQKYMGWYDMSPGHLDAMTEWELGSRLMEYLTRGLAGADGLATAVQAEYDNGNYQFAAQLSSLLLMRQTDEPGPADEKLKKLCADSLTQLGYMAEAGTWRNIYLSAAEELINGVSTEGRDSSSEMLDNLPADMLLDYIGIQFDCDRGSGVNYEDEFYVEIYEKEGAVGSAPEVHHVIVRAGAVLHAVAASVPSAYARIERSKLIGAMKQASSPSTCGAVRRLLEEAVTAFEADGAKDTAAKAVTSLYHLLGNLEFLALGRFKHFEIVRSRDQKVKVAVKKAADGTVTYADLDLRQEVKECVEVFKHIYEDMSKVKKDFLVTSSDALGKEIGEKWLTVEGTDGSRTYGYYDILVNQTAVLEDGRYFEQIPEDGGSHNYDGVGGDGQFRKAEYVHVLYEMYRYLAEPYLLSTTAPDREGEMVSWLRRGIKLLEPYIADFRHDAGGVRSSGVHSFDTTDKKCWDVLYHESPLDTLIQENNSYFQADCPGSGKEAVMGIGSDGQFYCGELLHMAYLFYRQLYSIYNPN